VFLHREGQILVEISSCYKAGCEEGSCYANAQWGCLMEKAKVSISIMFFPRPFFAMFSSQ
jgi:hypothetical protein